MITICDHLCFLAFGEVEEEIFREAVGVAANGLVKCPGGNAVEAGQIGIDEHRQTTEMQNGVGTDSGMALKAVGNRRWKLSE